MRSLTNFRGVSDPLAKVTKLGFLSIETDDVDTLVSYYTSSLGFVITEQTDSKVFLTTGADHHCVTVAPGSPHSPACVGFEILGTLREAAGRLQTAGLSFSERTDPDPGISADLLLEDPNGVPISLYESQTSSGQGAVPGVRPTKLGHLAVRVADLGQSQMFYEDVLGFRWSDTVGDFFTFLRCGPNHHSMNLIARPDPNGKTGGIHHVAYEARDLPHLRDILDHISKDGCQLEWGLGRHGAGHNLFSYHKDPDGNLVEVFTELDIVNDENTGYFEPRPWHESYPQGPQVWKPGPGSSNIWGPMPPWH